MKLRLAKASQLSWSWAWLSLVIFLEMRKSFQLGTNFRKIQAPGYWFLPSFVRTDFPFALMFPIIYYFDLVVKANSIASENLNFAEFRIYPHKIEECNCQGITCTLSGYSPKILGTAILRTYSLFSFNVL